MEEFSEGPVVDLNWIFEGPIEAVIKANVMAATAFYDFLAKYGFTGAGDNPGQGKMLGDLRMVSFSFEQPSSDSGPPVTRIFRVPFLSLVQLPLLEVKDATFEFGVRVLAAIPDHNARRINLLRASEDDEISPVKWRAALAPGGTGRADETRPDLSPHLAANLNAKVSVGQADIPAGIRNMLALMGENAQVTGPLLEVKPRKIAIFRISPGQTPAGTVTPPAQMFPSIVLKALTSARRHGDPPRITAFFPPGLTLIVRSGNDEWVDWPLASSRPTDDSGQLETMAYWQGETLPEDDTARITFRGEVDGATVFTDVECTILQPKPERTS